MELPPGPEDVVPTPVASCAHRRLPYGSITDDDFYAKLREARELDRAERRTERRDRSGLTREPRATMSQTESGTDTDGDDPKRLTPSLPAKSSILRPCPQSGMCGLLGSCPTIRIRRY